MTTNPPKPPITLTDPEDRGRLLQQEPHQPSLIYPQIGLLFLSLGARNPDAISEEDDDRLMSAGNQLLRAFKALNHAEELTHVEAALEFLHKFEQSVDL